MLKLKRRPHHCAHNMDATRGHSELFVDAETHRASLYIDAQMKQVAKTINESFLWDPETLKDEMRCRRAAVQLAVLMRDRCIDEGKSELLLAKSFVLIFQDWYRSHSHILIGYDNGAFVRSALSAAALEFALDGLRLAEAYFLELATRKTTVQRDVSSVIAVVLFVRLRVEPSAQART